jgi:hypothetical protein
MSLADYLRQPRNKRERRVANHAKKRERQLAIELWYREMACHCEEPMQHLLSRIKGEN